MLGMAIVGITVAVTGRWRGALRGWTPFACVWVLLSIPAMVLEEAAGGVVAAGQMIVGFGVLGVILALRPDLTRR